MDNWKKRVFFERRRLFVKKRRAQRLHGYCCFFEKRRYKWLKNAQLKTGKNKKLSNMHPNNDVVKTSKSQRYSKYCGLMKSRVASWTLPGVRGYRFLELLTQKMEIQGSILAPCEIRKGTLNLSFWVRCSFKAAQF